MVLVITGCFAECDCSVLRVSREQGSSFLIFPREINITKRCAQVPADHKAEVPSVKPPFGFRESRKWFSDLRRLWGARKEVTIIEKLKGRASLIRAVGDRCTTKCLENWADWHGAKSVVLSQPRGAGVFLWTLAKRLSRWEKGFFPLN